LKNIFRHVTENPVFKVGGIYTAVTFWDSFVGMVAGILMIRWIEPGELGIWQSLTIAQLYIGIFEIGVSSGLNRELPFSFGRGDRQFGNILAETTLSFMGMLSKTVAILTFLVCLCLYILSFDVKVVAGSFVVGMMAAINFYDRYLTVTYRSNEAFLSLSKVTFIKTLCQILFIPLVYFVAYYGLILYALSVMVVFVSLKHFYRPLDVRAVFRKEHFQLLFKTGFPVFIMNYVRSLTTTFNRTIILGFGGVLQVGLFTPVTAIGSMIDILPSVLGNFFFPKMNILYGKTNDPQILWPMALNLNALMMLLAIPFILCGWMLIPFIMENYFPKYVDSTYAMQLFTFNMLFAGTLVSHNVLYAVKNYKSSYIFNISELLVRAGLPLLSVILWSGNLLTLVVKGYLMSSFILFFLNIYLIRKSLFGNKNE
jgi:O-antigen/teichoic acid export membrane protein